MCVYVCVHLHMKYKLFNMHNWKVFAFSFFEIKIKNHECILYSYLTAIHTDLKSNDQLPLF